MATTGSLGTPCRSAEDERAILGSGTASQYLLEVPFWKVHVTLPSN